MYFYKKGFALSLVVKVKGFRTGKWPSVFLFELGACQEYDYPCRTVFVFILPVQFLPSPVKPTLQEQK